VSGHCITHIFILPLVPRAAWEFSEILVKKAFSEIFRENSLTALSQGTALTVAKQEQLPGKCAEVSIED